MAENSAISWTDHTWNPWIGCARISPACDGCYAAGLMGMEGGRFPKRVDWGGPGKGEGTRSRTAPSNWAKMRTLHRKAVGAGKTEFVFCASLADWADTHPDVAPWRRELFDFIHETPNFIYLLLTKRPGNIVKVFADTLEPEADKRDAALRERWPRNAALLCTIANQQEADRDLRKLLAAAAILHPAFTGVSMEPLLGPVDLTRIAGWNTIDALAKPEIGSRLDWVITGGETDQMTEEGMHRARPAAPAWFRSLRDQCAAAGVPFHFKQWGEWQALEGRDLSDERFLLANFGDQGHVYGIGKHRDPCTLDGVLHRARPDVRA